jgi:DNA-directed RNA polymerase I subunit RPA2
VSLPPATPPWSTAVILRYPRACGYNFYGTEPLYNGLTGDVMQADIFMGVVFYQRLRHMVSDKSQVRSTGPVTAVTRQPVKGRKNHGGIRLGEMERDALLSHGVAFCLQDRLMNCSDMHLAHVCGKCGSLLSVFAHTQDFANAGYGVAAQVVQKCSVCRSAAAVQPVHLPYVFRYLANELAGMGIKLTLKLSE